MNTLKYLILIGFLSAAMALPATASPAGNCGSEGQSAAAYPGDFSQQPNTLLRKIGFDADRVMDHAVTLKNFKGQHDIGWFANADELSRLRAEINDMGAKLCRLEAVRGAVAPRQRKAIDRVATTAQLMADNADAAIAFANSHRDDLWNPAYVKYVHNLYGEANQLMKVTGRAVKEYHQG